MCKDNKSRCAYCRHIHVNVKERKIKSYPLFTGVQLLLHASYTQSKCVKLM